MNTGDRLSDYLSAAQAKNLADAVQFAWGIDRPLNLLVTIHLDKAEMSGRPQSFVVSFLKLAGDWLRLRDIGRHYIWVLERPPGRGLNLHIMIHWVDEDERQLRRRFVRWLKVSGGINRRNVLKCQYVDTSHAVARYLLKGADPDFCEEWPALEPRFQGSIRGKRCGTSESLGARARAVKKVWLPDELVGQRWHYVLCRPKQQTKKLRVGSMI